MRAVVISQPRYLPALNYLHRMLIADLFIYLDTVQYTPRDYENRNRINTAQGPTWLSVPVVNAGRTQLIRDTRIDNSRDWSSKHLRSLELSYRRAPFFDRYFPSIEAALRCPYGSLAELDAELIEVLMSAFAVKCERIWASSLDIDGCGEELLLQLCKRTGGDAYISGSHGRDYLRGERWRAEGIALRFHDYAPVPYPQLHGSEFVPWLSAVDLLFNCGGERGREVLITGQADSWEKLPDA